MSFPIEELLEINKFSNLHDGNRVVFCKTDYLYTLLPALEAFPHEIILISGNSDYSVSEERLSFKPDNVVKWFGPNKSADSDIVVPIPLGIENSICCKLGYHHGFVWDHAPEKHGIISETQNKPPTKMIYANFEVHQSRHPSRVLWKDIAQNHDHITWQPDNALRYADYIDEVLDHEAVLCPQGNVSVPEGDNHRLYEVLYSGRIPITHAQTYHKTLHHKFPVILVEDLEAVSDEKFMRSEIDRVKSQTYDHKYLRFSYWRDLILAEKEKLK